jgi:uncharacterized lipoprotein YddW (UPF0748 family)
VTLLPVLEAGPGEDIADLWRAQTSIDDEGAIIAKASTAPAEGLTLGGAPVLKLTCNFAGTTIPRGVWDRTVELDLSGCTAVYFDVYAENVRAIGHSHLYLRAGDGWYGAHWYPGEQGQWCRIRLPLGEFYVDKRGGGWGDIRTIRFSPWVGAREDAVLHIANFGLETTPASAALVMPGYSTSEGSARALGKYATVVVKLLDQAGCAMPILSTSDLTPERLADLKLLVMPYVSRLPEEATELVAEFIRGGGKIIACYSLPRALAEPLGVSQQGFRTCDRAGEFSSMRFEGEPPWGAPAEVRQASWAVIDSEAIEGVAEVAAWWHDADGERTDAPAIIMSDSGAWFSHVLFNDDPANKGRLLVSLIEQFAPGSADLVAQRRIAQLGARMQTEDWEAAVALTREQPSFEEASEALIVRAAAVREEAIAATDPFEAMTLADDAEEQLMLAFCQAQVSVEGEFRATWCHPPAGIAGWGWPKTADRLKEGGIEHLFLNAAHGASASYASEVLPFDKQNTEGIDYLQQAVDACSERGIKVHVWMTNFKARGHAPASLVEQLDAEERFCVRSDGTVLDTLCPSDPRNQDLQIRAMVEAAHLPGVAGIHFDYIRYPSGDTCFCDGCKERFAAYVGKPVEGWPAAVGSGGALREQWLDFRRSNITRVVREVSETVRREVPDCMISAAVFSSYPWCAESVAQDWVAWVDAGYLDFICPMDYTASHTEFRVKVTTQLAQVQGKIPCYPGIGLLKGLGPVGAMRQIQICRELGAGGFVIWSVYPAYIDTYSYLGMSPLPEGQ